MDQFDFPFAIRCSVTYDDRTVTSFIKVTDKLVDCDIELESESINLKNF